MNANEYECQSFGHCDAPLCPLDATSLVHGTWFPDEVICVREGCRERWIDMQKRIAKKTRERGRGYFTVAMLEALAAVGRAITGVDPNCKDAPAAEAAWCARKRRPGYSPEERERRRTAAIAMHERRKSTLRQNSDAEKVSGAKPDVSCTTAASRPAVGARRQGAEERE